MTRYSIDIWNGMKWKFYRFCFSIFLPKDDEITFFCDGESITEKFITVTIKLERENDDKLPNK